jgi:hypothetical protein
MTPIDWLLSDDTGVSSKTICAVMTGAAALSFGADTPSDPDDFGRCYRLLKHFPEWRARMPEVAKKHPKFGPMVEAWDELTALYEQLCWPDGKYTRASYEKNKEVAKKLYDRMCELNDAGRLADGWTKTGDGCWSRQKSSEISLGGISMRFGA